MANWDGTKPGDTDIVSQFPANERAARAAVQTNFAVNHYDTNDANVGKHKTINLLDAGADPSAVAGQGNIYSKSVSARSELFWRDSTGAAVQITSAGVLNYAGFAADAARLSQVNAFTNLNTITTSDNVAQLTLAGSTSKIKLHGYHLSFVGAFFQVRNAADSADAPLQINSSTIAFGVSLANFSINGTAASDFARLSIANPFTATNTFSLNSGTIFRSTIATAAINNYLSFQDSALAERGYVGFGIGASSIFSVRNATASAELRLSTNGGAITLNGVDATDFARLSQQNPFNSGAAAQIASWNSTHASGAYMSFQRSGTTHADIGNGAQMGVGFTLDSLALSARAGFALELAANGATTPQFKISTAGAITLNGVNATNFARIDTTNTFLTRYIIDTPTAGSLFNEYRVAGVTFAYIGDRNAVTGGAAGSLALRSQGSFVLATGGGGAERLIVDSSGNFDFKSGTVATANASASEVGKAGIPQTNDSASYTCVLADANNARHQTGATQTYTIPANASVVYPIGTTLTFSVDNATGVSIAITTDTLRLAGTATTGTRTLAQYGTATARKIAATTWLIAGMGLS